MSGFGFYSISLRGKKKDKEKTLTFLAVKTTNLLNNNLFKLSGIFSIATTNMSFLCDYFA